MDWHIIAAAVATAVAVHGAMEPQNVNLKLQRLAKAIRTGKIEELKMKGIDSRPKAYALGAIVITVLSTIAYGVLSLVDPSPEAALQYMVVVLLLGEASLIFGLDKYHADIEKVTQEQKK